MRIFWTVCFWIWGVIGLAINLITPLAYWSLGLKVAVGVLGSTVPDNLWIGGMVLFGLGALLCVRNPPRVRPNPSDSK